jgi:hypothetical protein
MLRCLQLTRLGDNQLGLGSTGLGTKSLDLLNNVETLNNFSEHNVLTIQPWTWDSGDEELGTVGVWTSVGHGQQTWSVVSLSKVLVSKLLTVDGLTTGTITSGEVTTLQHELWDDSVEWGTLVTKTLLTSTQSSEVLSSLWDNVVVQLEDDLTDWLA